MSKLFVISDATSFARVLKDQRRAAKTTQTILAQMFGLSRFTVVDAESGKGAPKLSTLLTLLNGLGLSLVVLPSNLVQSMVVMGVGSDRRCCTRLSAEDSHRESMRLDGLHEQAFTRPLPHQELAQLHGGAAQTRFFADLAGQGDDLARTA